GAVLPGPDTSVSIPGSPRRLHANETGTLPGGSQRRGAGQGTSGAPGHGLSAGARPSADRRPARHGQDHAQPHPGPGAGAGLPAHTVHLRPTSELYPPIIGVSTTLLYHPNIP